MPTLSTTNMHKFTNPKASNSKTVRCYATPDSPRCAIKLLDTYISLLTPDSNYFYIKPRSKFPKVSGQPAYTKQLVGINNIKNFVSSITSVLPQSSKYTNHRLRVTPVTQMYNTGIPEKVIFEKSDHHSIEGLRAYKRTSNEMEKMAEQSISGETVKQLEIPKLKKDPEEQPQNRARTALASPKLLCNEQSHN